MDLYEAVMVVDGETEDDSLEYRVKAMQALINNGMAWTLQGRVGREAMALVEAGYCALGPESRRDYWGNRVPSRFDVEPGTKGSVEFVRAQGHEVEE